MQKDMSGATGAAYSRHQSEELLCEQENASEHISRQANVRALEEDDPIKILIADDHPIWREGLASLIRGRADMQVVGEATTGREAVELYRQHRPDVTLMDMRMPEMDGVEAITAICTEFPTACILILSTYDGDENVYQGLHAGAQGYLFKTVPWEEFLEAIRTVHAGKKYLPRDVAAQLAERVQSLELSSREVEVLRLVAQGESNKAVAAALHITEGTVKVHIGSILSKLTASDRTQAVTIALKRGILNLQEALSQADISKGIDLSTPESRLQSKLKMDV